MKFLKSIIFPAALLLLASCSKDNTLVSNLNYRNRVSGNRRVRKPAFCRKTSGKYHKTFYFRRTFSCGRSYSCKQIQHLSFRRRCNRPCRMEIDSFCRTVFDLRRIEQYRYRFLCFDNGDRICARIEPRRNVIIINFFFFKFSLFVFYQTIK